MNRLAPPPNAEARSVRVTGVVQGVGFRPFVWQLAKEHGLAGWVRNRGGMVEILVEGSSGSLDAFCAGLTHRAPPLADVERVWWESTEPEGLAGFAEEAGADLGEGDRLVAPEVATCPACLAELFDPADRRYRYPFISCKECGPRFTIIEALPYGRERTSMRAFPPCLDCRTEYEDPTGRRFHAEAVACPACGPKITLLGSGWRPLPVAPKGHDLCDPVEQAAKILREGGILAVKGPGGFHLVCDATADAAVAELRARKALPDEPFAVMAATPEVAGELFRLSPAEASLLKSPQAPIVLVRSLGRLAPSVAPGFRRHGAMLPSTPLQHLLLREAGRPLVMAGGSRGDEPTCVSNDAARRRLGKIADAFLVDDREVVARYDDSVAMLRATGPVVLRRARGIAPAPLELPAEVSPVLGTGAQRHGAFCLAAGNRAFLSPDIGDLGADGTMVAYRDALNRYGAVFGVDPQTVAHDLHPDWAATRFAQSTGLPDVAVQHHHAHVAAVMAEHGLSGSVLGVAFDGFGLGTDGTAWGGEFLVCDWSNARRVGHLRAVRQPGNAAAVRNPVRMALAHAADAGALRGAKRLLGVNGSLPSAVLKQVESGVNSPWTSSVGRLFDAVAALTGVCREATYDGQPAMLLEQAADASATFEYPFDLGVEDGLLVIDTRPIIAAVVHDLVGGRTQGEVAGRFHRTLTAAVLAACRLLRGQTGLTRVCLGGGVFQNDLLTSDVSARLSACDFEVFVPRAVPPGDGGIALGQVLVAHGRTGDQEA